MEPTTQPKGIIFENIDTGETLLISRTHEGKHYRAKLSAIMNSSNLHVNADRGQDFGYRLQPEQQALLEEWEQDFDTIDKVSRYTKVPVDSLTHAEFLAYLLYTLEAGKSSQREDANDRRVKQAEYQARVAALRAAKPEVLPEFKAPAVDNTVENFLNGSLTGDAGGDKAEEELVEDEATGNLITSDEAEQKAVDEAKAFSKPTPKTQE